MEPDEPVASGHGQKKRKGWRIPEIPEPRGLRTKSLILSWHQEVHLSPWHKQEAVFALSWTIPLARATDPLQCSHEILADLVSLASCHLKV